MSVSEGRKCGAKTRAGGVCQHEPGWGTDHAGYGRCKLHGGSHRNGRKAAQREQAERAVATYGLPREVDPHTALLEELWRTAGHVAWLQAHIAAFETERDLKQYAPAGSEKDEQGNDHAIWWEKPAVWIELYHRERKHLAEVAKTCVAVGIEERRVRIAEQQGEQIDQLLRGVLTELGVIDRPEVPAIVRRHLTLLAGTG